MGSLTPEELAKFTEMNNAYREKFDFPFILAVRGATKHVLRTDVLFEARDPPAAAEAAPTAPPPPPPPAVGDVAGLLASLGLDRCRGAVECLGLEGASLDALLAPGRAATAAMLAELDVADDDVGALLDAAEAALKGS